MAPDVHFQFTHISVDEVLQQLQCLDVKRQLDLIVSLPSF